MLVKFEKLDKRRFENNARLEVSPAQKPYVCADLEAFVQQWRDDQEFDCFLIKESGVAVGFFALDFNRERHADYVLPNTTCCVLRCFFIDERYQGRGLAGLVLRELERFLPAQYPRLEVYFLTVNFANATAIRAYLKAGFKKLEKPFLGGQSGPQHVMVKRL